MIFCDMFSWQGIYQDNVTGGDIRLKGYCGIAVTRALLYPDFPVVTPVGEKLGWGSSLRVFLPKIKSIATRNLAQKRSLQISRLPSFIKIGATIIPLQMHC